MIERGQIRIPVRIPDKSVFLGWRWVDMDIFDAPEEDFRRYVFTKLGNPGQITYHAKTEKQQAITEKEAIPKERG